jgi:hypothetical protein
MPDPESPQPPSQPQPPAPPSSPEPPGETPADKALREAGGEIIPKELGGSGTPTVIPSSGRPLPVAPQQIDVAGARPVVGSATPEPPVRTPEQLRWEQSLAESINVELNIYHACFQSTRNMVNTIVASQPLDSADIGNATWGKGARTPLEAAEPEIALEVYREIKRQMRDDERKEMDSTIAALKKLMEKVR